MNEAGDGFCHGRDCGVLKTFVNIMHKTGDRFTTNGYL